MKRYKPVFTDFSGIKALAVLAVYALLVYGLKLMEDFLE